VEVILSNELDDFVDKNVATCFSNINVGLDCDYTILSKEVKRDPTCFIICIIFIIV